SVKVNVPPGMLVLEVVLTRDWTRLGVIGGTLAPLVDSRNWPPASEPATERSLAVMGVPAPDILTESLGASYMIEVPSFMKVCPEVRSWPPWVQVPKLMPTWPEVTLGP